jgi:hypothetical protein
MNMLDRQRLDLFVADAFNTTDYTILGSARMYWCGWEADTAAALIRLADGRVAWAVLDGVTIAADEVADILRGRIEIYKRAIVDTRALLALAESLGVV